jgi:hypothetical protein
LYLLDTVVAIIPPEVSLDVISPSHFPHHTVGQNAEIRCFYENRTNRDIWVVERSGLAFKIPAEKDVLKRNQTFRKVDCRYINAHDTDSGKTLGMAEAYGAIHDKPKRETKVIHDHVLDVIRSQGGGYLTKHIRNQIGFEHVLRLETIMDFDQGFYWKELDVVIFVGRDNDVEKVLHPYSPMADRKRTLENIELNGNQHGFNLSVVIVDNANQFSARFIKLGNTPIQVPIIRDGTKGDGVYITKYDPKAKHEKRLLMEFVEMETADRTIPLFKNAEDALNSERDKDREEQRRQHEQKCKLEDEKLNLDREKLVVETNKLEVEKSLIAIKQETNKTDASRHEDLLRLKDRELKESIQARKQKDSDDKIKRDIDNQRYREDRDYRRGADNRNYQMDIVKNSIAVASLGFSLYKLIKS